MIALPLSRYRFTYTAEGPGLLRAFAGSAWRGAFGIALKQTVCAMRLRDCDGCPLLDTCIFPRLFEGRQRVGAARFASLVRIPVPYVFHPAQATNTRFTEGEKVEVDLTLIGSANRCLVYVLHAMAEAGTRGVGPGRAPLRLITVDRLQDLEGTASIRIFEAGERLEAPEPRTPAVSELHRPMLSLKLRTPLRLRLDGDLVTPDRFRPAQWIDAVVQRVSALAACHAAPIAARGSV